jgi:hypothetical protein
VGRLAHIQDLDDPGVLYAAESAGVALQAGKQVGIAGVFFVQDLDRHLVFRGHVNGPIDGARPVLSELLAEDVVARVLRVGIHGTSPQRSAAARSHTRIWRFAAGLRQMTPGRSRQIDAGTPSTRRV